MNLRLNILLEWTTDQGKPRVDRVIGIASKTSIITIDVSDEKAFPVYCQRDELETAIIAGRARIVQRPEYNIYALPDDQIDPAYLECRDERWKLIGPLIEQQGHLLFNRRDRGRLVAELAKNTGRRKALIYDLLRRFWQRGGTKDALRPAWHLCGQVRDRKDHGKKRGRPSLGGRNVTAEDQKIFTDGVKKLFISDKRRDLRFTWQLILENYYAVGTKTQEDGSTSPLIPPADTIPTFEQFEYYYRKDRDYQKEIVGREGQKEYDQNYRPILGDSTLMAFGPGSVYQVDAAIGDIYLVNYLDRKCLIGRPVNYIVIDVFSRLIAGLAITLEGPSWEGARLALENAFLSKIAFCKQYGINIQDAHWPAVGICEGILGDNGEIRSYNANSLVSLGVRVANAASYRPDWKAIVERRFRTVNDIFIRWLPGAVHQRRRVRGNDYRLDATLDINQFRQMMIECVLFYNNHRRLQKYRKDEYMIPRHIPPVPILLWRYGMERRTGHLREEHSDVILQNLLPSATASIRPEGIYFRGLYYTCDKALREQWCLRIKGRKPIVKDITFDPNLVDSIYLRPKPGKELVRCTLTPADRRFQGRDWYEMQQHFARDRQEAKAAETDSQQAAADFHSRINRIEEAGARGTTEAWGNEKPSKAARLAGIRPNRESLKNHERKQRVGTSQQLPADAAVATVIPMKLPNKPPAPDGYVAPARPYDELREARERATENAE